MVNYDHLPKDSRYFNGTLYQKMNSSLQTTMIYLHLTDTAEQCAREAIEKIFRRR